MDTENMNTENMNTENMNTENHAQGDAQGNGERRSSQEMDLTEQFTRVAWLLNRYRLHSYMAHGPMGDPHRGQGRVLSLLKLKPEISQRELLYLLDMRPQSLGELLAKLERSGYITRTVSAVDRRVVEIRLTEAGAKVASENEQQAGFASLFDTLSQEEQANLSDYLGRLIAHVEEELGDEPQRDDFDWRDRRRGRQPFDRDQEWGRGGPHHGPFGHHGGRERGRMPFAGFDPRGRLRGMRGSWAGWQRDERTE